MFVNLSMNELSKEAHRVARSKGWYEKEVPVSEFIANTHAELSEVFEEYRAGKPLKEIKIEENGKPEGIPAELADVIIRIADFCGCHDIDIDAAVQIKMAFNKTRSHRHGGKIV